MSTFHFYPNTPYSNKDMILYIETRQNEITKGQTDLGYRGRTMKGDICPRGLEGYVDVLRRVPAFDLTVVHDGVWNQI